MSSMSMSMVDHGRKGTVLYVSRLQHWELAHIWKGQEPDSRPVNGKACPQWFTLPTRIHLLDVPQFAQTVPLPKDKTFKCEPVGNI